MTWRSRSCFFFSSRRRHTRSDCNWSSDVCSSDLLTDSRADALPRALGRLNDLLAVAVKRGKLAEPERATAAGRLRAEHQLAPAVSGAEVEIGRALCRERV